MLQAAAEVHEKKFAKAEKNKASSSDPVLGSGQAAKGSGDVCEGSEEEAHTDDAALDVD